MQANLDVAAGYDAAADSALTPVEGDSLSILHALAADFTAKQAAMTAAEEAFKKAKAEFELVEQKRIPDWLEEHGMEKFEHTDPSGVKTVITSKDATVASIPAASREAAFAWLDSIGKGEVIAHTLEVDLGRVSKEVVEALETAIKLTRPGTEVLVGKSVNANTLSALVRRLLAEGTTKFPEESVLKVHRLRKATVKIG